MVDFSLKKHIKYWMVTEGYPYFRKPSYIVISHCRNTLWTLSERWNDVHSPVCDTLTDLLNWMADCHWLVVWNIVYFSIYWEVHNPNWLIFFRARYTTNHDKIKGLIGKSSNYVREYSHNSYGLIWYSTSILGSWNLHWIYWIEWQI